MVGRNYRAIEPMLQAELDVVHEALDGKALAIEVDLHTLGGT